jgi:hypothetical protein
LFAVLSLLSVCHHHKRGDGRKHGYKRKSRATCKHHRKAVFHFQDRAQREIRT